MKNTLTLILTLLVLTQATSAQSSDSSNYFLNLGILQKQERKFLSASKLFDQAIAADTKNIKAYIESALVNLEMKRPTMAISNFEKANNLDSKNELVIKNLAELYFNFKNYSLAIQFAKACKNCENSTRIIGLSLFAMEEYPQAEKMLLTLNNGKDEDPQVLYTLGRGYLNMDEYDKAIVYYEKAVIVDPTKSIWIYELGLIYYNQQKFANAVTSFEKAAAAGYPQSLNFKENLGYAAIESGQYEKGENLLMEISSKKTGNTSIIRDLTLMFYQKKLYDKSLTYCQLLLEKNPNDAKALYQAGLNFQHKGEKEKGQKMCDKAIEMEPALESLKKKKEMPGM
ncbi:MAG: tetratricopeptide repeat protein [Ferruginibacter sp.]